jgi:CRP/FNR family cyclic AMP-dependent transcriptional regulator
VVWDQPGVRDGKAQGAAALLDADPDLGEDLSNEQLALARRRVVAEIVGYPAGGWTVGPDDFHRAAKLGLLLIEGVIVREVTVGDYTCAELLGPGDVIQPWLRIGPDESVASEVDWEVIEPVSLAVLGRDFIRRSAPWPEIPAAIARRLMQRAHWLAFHLAVCGLRRVDDRLMIVLWHFADRWGRVTPDGVRLDLRLTHEVLAAVVGARRPSVTSGLKRLIEAGRVRPQPRSRWLLLGRAPAELRQLHEGSRRRTTRRASPAS